MPRWSFRTERRVDPMRMNAKERDSGMTLIEVLASVLILGLFASVFVMFFNQPYSISKISGEKQQAMVIAENALAVMTDNGVENAISNSMIPLTQQQNGTTYQLAVSFATPSQSQPPLTFPSWADKGIYVEVMVYWSSEQAGKKVTKSVDIERLFPS
jgi:prepilin-type N-terminal cleavage/methylation domain-containing protein